MRNENCKPTAKNGLSHTTATLKTVLQLHSNAHNPRATQAESIGAWKANYHITTNRLRVDGTSGDCMAQPLCLSTATHRELLRTMSSFGIPLRWRLHKHFRQPMPVYGHPYRSKVFQSVPIASGPATEHHQKALLPILYTLQVFIHIYEILWVFFRLNILSSSSLSLHKIQSSHLITLVILCWIFFRITYPDLLGALVK